MSLLPLGELSCYQDQIESELEKSRPKLRGIYAAYVHETGERPSRRATTPGRLFTAGPLFFVDPRGKGIPAGPTSDYEDRDLQSASRHLTQNFLCQVMQEEGGWGGPEEREPQGSPALGCPEEREPEGSPAIGCRPPSVAELLDSSAAVELRQSFQMYDEDRHKSGEPTARSVFFILAWRRGAFSAFVPIRLFPVIWRRRAFCIRCFVLRRG